MNIEIAERIKKIPLYLFSRIDELKKMVNDRQLIDLGMGNPDLPTPSHIVEKLKESLMLPSSSRYPPARGEEELRKAIAQWYKQRYNVHLDPDKEVLPLIGSKEGIAITYLTFLNSGDIAIVPTPAYPVHFNGVILAGGIPYSLPIRKENNFLPDFSSIPEKILKKAKIIFICYPNNPTTAIANREFFKEAVTFAQKYNLILAHDFAYAEITFDGYRPPSLLQIEGSRERGIEFYSFSKTYNMAGWRIGCVVGNSDLINFISKTKSYVDFGIFSPIQKAAAFAIQSSQDCVKDLCKVYKRRRDILVEGLRKYGWQIDLPRATMYVWAPLPPSYSKLKSQEFSEFLVKKIGVITSPGTGFGEEGEGYIRFALVESEERIKEAIERITSIL